MDVEGCLLPDELRYDLDNDVWVRADAAGEWTMGLLASLSAFAGSFVSVRFRPLEGMVRRGQSVATVESYRYTGAVRMPADGTVVERNEALKRSPKLLNRDPYGEGWVVRFCPLDPATAIASLKPAEAVAERLRTRIRELRIRCYPEPPDLELIEIGVECSAALARLTEEVGRRAPGEVVLLVTDDPTSPVEMVRWSDRTGHGLLHQRREGNLYHFLVRREAAPKPRRRSDTGTV